MINQQNGWPIKVFNKQAAFTGWLLKFLGYSVIAVSLLAGCEERQCPKKTRTEFMPDSQKALVPYETGDTLVFLFNLSGSKDTVTFTGEKNHKFKEERKRLGDCGVKIQKYEQFHYNFYSEDSVHHLKMKTDPEISGGGLDIQFNKIVDYGIAFSHFGNSYIEKEGQDTAYCYKMINFKKINAKKYYNLFYKVNNRTNKKIFYNKKYGVLLLRQNSKIWSLLKFK